MVPNIKDFPNHPNRNHELTGRSTKVPREAGIISLLLCSVWQDSRRPSSPFSSRFRISHRVLSALLLHHSHSLDVASAVSIVIPVGVPKLVPGLIFAERDRRCHFPLQWGVSHPAPVGSLGSWHSRTQSCWIDGGECRLAIRGGLQSSYLWIRHHEYEYKLSNIPRVALRFIACSCSAPRWRPLMFRPEQHLHGVTSLLVSLL